MYTLLHPSKSHLWIRRFLESGDSDLRWRLVLSILNGEIELEKEKVDLNGEQYSTLFGSSAMRPEAHRLQLHTDPRSHVHISRCHLLGHISFLNLEGRQLDLFLMKHS